MTQLGMASTKPVHMYEAEIAAFKNKATLTFISRKIIHHYFAFKLDKMTFLIRWFNQRWCLFDLTGLFLFSFLPYGISLWLLNCFVRFHTDICTYTHTHQYPDSEANVFLQHSNRYQSCNAAILRPEDPSWSIETATKMAEIDRYVCIKLFSSIHHMPKST